MRVAVVGSSILGVVGTQAPARLHLVRLISGTYLRDITVCLCGGYPAAWYGQSHGWHLHLLARCLGKAQFVGKYLCIDVLYRLVCFHMSSMSKLAEP